MMQKKLKALSKAQNKILDERESEALSGKVSKKSWAEIKKSITRCDTPDQRPQDMEVTKKVRS